MAVSRAAKVPALACVAGTLLVGTMGGHAAEALTPKDLEFFEKKIRPVLATNCYACHSAEAKTRMGGLSLDTRDGIRTGGQRGHAVVPKDVEASLIVAVLRYDGALKMPPTGKLEPQVVEDFIEWINMGAPDPRAITVQVEATAIDLEAGREYWAFQAPPKGSAPPIKNVAWPEGLIDQYVLAGLESQGLNPVGEAGREELLRRVTFDLTGLPPTPTEIDEFLRDDSEFAFRSVVDRLLDSDRFGERWGRHWLDVVRYGDTVGRARNLPFPTAWRYRDYVIRAFNEDKPYDRFLREQIAGDLLPSESREERIENQIATGFLAIGAHNLNEPDVKQFEMDVADELINTTTRSVLALSVGCARCHDHKFDPIPTTDYYALAGIFRSSELRNGLRRRPSFSSAYFQESLFLELEGIPEFSKAEATEVRSTREALLQELKAAEKAKDRDKRRELASKVAKLPLPENRAMGVIEAEPTTLRVNIGGDPHTLGKPVPRGFVQALFPDGASLPKIGDRESGRLQLAQWLTRPDNPLTARVMANRIWHHLFGRGIVATVDNFGKTGRQPTHPELLDYLAVQFQNQEWSVKSLIREIVLSRTYRLAADFDSANYEIDPDNRFLWRANMRRLEVEALRDAVLLTSGQLKLGAPPPSPVNGFDRRQNIIASNSQVEPWEIQESYRSVYVPVIRNIPSRLFEAFDFPEASETHGSRDVTTGPSQALFLMNNDFVQLQAAIAAERLLTSHERNPERIQYAFRQVFSRDPTLEESARALRHIRETAKALESDPSPGNEQGVTAPWVSGLLARVLKREPEANEMESAMDFLRSHNEKALESATSSPSVSESDRGSTRKEREAATAILEHLLERQPNREERTTVAKYFRELGAQRRRQRPKPRREDRGAVLASSGSVEQRAWAQFYHALYNSAEFRYTN